MTIEQLRFNMQNKYTKYAKIIGVMSDNWILNNYNMERFMHSGLLSYQERLNILTQSKSIPEYEDKFAKVAQERIDVHELHS